MALISKEYLSLQKKLHENPNYGVASISFAPLIAQIVKQNNITSISDFGAGKKRLLAALKKHNVKLENYFAFDPAFPEYGEPKSADLVCCIDVLEHIEIEYLDSVLNELARIHKKIGFLSIHTGPAGKTLEDGRNAHLIQQTSSWWLPKLCEYFEILHLQNHQINGHGFWVITKKASKSES